MVLAHLVLGLLIGEPELEMVFPQILQIALVEDSRFHLELKEVLRVYTVVVLVLAVHGGRYVGLTQQIYVHG